MRARKTPRRCTRSGGPCGTMVSSEPRPTSESTTSSSAPHKGSELDTSPSPPTVVLISSSWVSSRKMPPPLGHDLPAAHRRGVRRAGLAGEAPDDEGTALTAPYSAPSARPPPWPPTSWSRRRSSPSVATQAARPLSTSDRGSTPSRQTPAIRRLTDGRVGPTDGTDVGGRRVASRARRRRRTSCLVNEVDSDHPLQHPSHIHGWGASSSSRVTAWRSRTWSGRTLALPHRRAPRAPMNRQLHR